MLPFWYLQFFFLEKSSLWQISYGMLLLLHLKNSLVLCYTLHNHGYPRTSQPSTTSSMDDRTQCNGLDKGNDVGNLILLTVVRKSEKWTAIDSDDPPPQTNS